MLEDKRYEGTGGPTSENSRYPATTTKTSPSSTFEIFAAGVLSMLQLFLRPQGRRQTHGNNTRCPCNKKLLARFRHCGEARKGGLRGAMRKNAERFVTESPPVPGSVYSLPCIPVTFSRYHTYAYICRAHHTDSIRTVAEVVRIAEDTVRTSRGPFGQNKARVSYLSTVAILD